MEAEGASPQQEAQQQQQANSEASEARAAASDSPSLPKSIAKITKPATCDVCAARYQLQRGADRIRPGSHVCQNCLRRAIDAIVNGALDERKFATIKCIATAESFSYTHAPTCRATHSSKWCPNRETTGSCDSCRMGETRDCSACCLARVLPHVVIDQVNIRKKRTAEEGRRPHVHADDAELTISQSPTHRINSKKASRSRVPRSASPRSNSATPLAAALVPSKSAPAATSAKADSDAKPQSKFATIVANFLATTGDRPHHPVPLAEFLIALGLGQLENIMFMAKSTHALAQVPEGIMAAITPVLTSRSASPPRSPQPVSLTHAHTSATSTLHNAVETRAGVEVYIPEPTESFAASEVLLSYDDPDSPINDAWRYDSEPISFSLSDVDDVEGALSP